MNRDVFHDTAVVAPRQLVNMLHPRIVEGMDQHTQIDVLKITTPHKLHLAAEKFNLAFGAQLFAVSHFDQLLRRHRHQPDGAAQPVQHARLLQRRRCADQPRCLRVMAAGMHRLRYRITIRMLRADQRIQLAHQTQLRSRPAGVQIGVKARYPLRLDQVIAQVGKNLFQIRACLPFLKARFRVLPDHFRSFTDERRLFVHRRV